MANSIDRSRADNPLILTVPGLANSGPEHWQTLWEQQIPDCQCVDLGMWDRPHRNTWVNKLNLAIERTGLSVILVAHSLGCLTVAWWAKYEQLPEGHPVLGALLVAPPEVDFFPADERLAKFAPTPVEPLPFPSIFAASRNDPYMGIRSARRLAQSWASRFADAGAIGHINAESGIGDWPFGRFLLDQLLKPNQPLRMATCDGVGPSGEAFRLAHGREASPALP